MPFWDQTAPGAEFAVHLPDPLRLRASGLQWPQIRVYDEFSEYDGQGLRRRPELVPGGFDNKRNKVPGRPTSTLPFGRSDALAPIMSRTPAAENVDRQLSSNQFLSHQDAMERFVVGPIFLAQLYVS